jgi:hypothetical protein
LVNEKRLRIDFYKQIEQRMPFSIQFVEQGSWESWFAPGELVLNDSIESFVASVDPGTEWTRRDYERQWREASIRQSRIKSSKIGSPSATLDKKSRSGGWPLGMW